MVEQQVEQDGHDCGRADAGVEDGLEPGREVLVKVGCGNRDHAETDRCGDDDQVHVVAIVHLRQGADAAGGDGTKQDQASTAKHGSGHGGDQATHHRQQPQCHQDQAAGGHHITAHDTGHGDQAYVLCKGALGKGAEQRRQGTGNHVCAQAVAKAFGVDLGVDDFAHCQDIGGGLDHGHDNHDQHRQDGCEAELGHAEVQHLGQCDQRAFQHPGEVGHAHGRGNQCADNDSQQNRQA